MRIINQFDTKKWLSKGFNSSSLIKDSCCNFTYSVNQHSFVSTCTEQYRYAMNGQEQEDEVFEGASSAEYWMYDSRTGRRFENDPLVYEYQSPYVCFNNNPIYFADPLGLEGTNEGGGESEGVGEGEPTKNNPNIKLKEPPQNLPTINITAFSTTPPISEREITPTDASSVKQPVIASTNKPEAPSFLDKVSSAIGNFFSRWARFDDEIGHRIRDRNDDYTKRPPVQTNNGGETPFGDGATINEHIYGNPEGATSSINPGSLLYSLGKFSPNFSFGIPKWIEQIQKTGDATDGVVETISNIGKVRESSNKPKLTKTNNDSITKDIWNRADGKTIDTIVITWDKNDIRENGRKAKPKNILFK